MNTGAQAYGASPWGGTWGSIPWDEAARLPGSAQLGMAARFLQRCEWWRFEPHQDWVSPAPSPERIDLPFAASIPGQVRIIYIYGPTFMPNSLTVQKTEPGYTYKAFWWDPRTGAEHALGVAQPDAAGAWTIPMQPKLADGVLVLERAVGQA